MSEIKTTGWKQTFHYRIYQNIDWIKARSIDEISQDKSMEKKGKGYRFYLENIIF